MAVRYWVAGGTGNWSSTTNWSATSGGGSGASVPTSADDVVFNASSGTAFNSIVDTATTITNLTITPSATVGYQIITISSSLTVTGTFSMSGTAGNKRTVISSAVTGLRTNFVVAAFSSLSDLDFQDIRVTGAAGVLNGTRIGDLRGNTGVTFSAPKTSYWVTLAGGSWTGTNWSNASGGTASTDYFPLAQDTAVIDNTSLNATGTTVTLDATVYPFYGTVDMSTRSNAFTLALATSATYVFGDWKNGSGTTLSGAFSIRFVGRNTQSITSAGKTFLASISVESFGGTVQLVDTINITTSLIVTHGTFKSNNQTINASILSSSNSNVRSIYFGSSTVNLSSTGTPVNLSTSTNLSFYCGTSTINCTGAGSPSFDGGAGQTFYNVNFTAMATAAIATISGPNTFNTLTVTPTSSAGIVGLSFGDTNQTFTTLNVAGASAIRRVFVKSSNTSIRTLTVGTLSANDCDFKNITIAGAAAGSSPTRAGDCGGNTGITFPAAKTVYWNLTGTQVWAATAWCTSSDGGSTLSAADVNNFPLAQDTAVFNDVGSATTVTFTNSWNVGTINASARLNALTLSSVGAPIIYGNFTLGTGITTTSTTIAYTFSGGTQTITSAGRTFNCPIVIDGGAVSSSFPTVVQLADAINLLSSRSITVTSGTFNAVSYNVTAGAVSGGAAGDIKMGSGLWTLSGTGTVWTHTLGTTIDTGTANILLSDTSTTSRTFLGQGWPYNKLTIGGTTGTSTLTFSDSNSFTELASTKTVAHTIALGTNTLTFGAWTVTGTAGNVVTVTGTGTISISGARVSGVDYLALGTTTISATSLGEFYAGANSTGGTNAILTAAPTARTLYWRGGAGTWDATTTTNWSTSSGGSGGASVPTSADAVVFDSSSNATAYTVTCTATQLRCASLSFAGPASGNVTWAGTAPIAVHGNFTIPATGLTRSYTGALTFSGSATGKTINTNNISLASTININGVGCGWTLGGLFTTSSTFTLTNGAFDTGGYAVSSSTLVSSSQNSNRSLTLGASTWTTTGSTTVLNINTTGLTFNKGTSSFACTGATATITVQDYINSSGMPLTINNISFTSTSTSKVVNINAALTVNTFSYTAPTTACLIGITCYANQTITTLTFPTATDATCRAFIKSDTLGTTRTFTVGTFTAGATDIDFRDITIAGAAAPISGTRFGDCKGNSGITFPSTKTVYWNLAAGGNWGGAIGWAASSGGTPAINNFPLAQDTAIFEATGLTSGSTITINADYNIGTINMSARTVSSPVALMTLATGSTTPYIYGNWTNGTGVSFSGTASLLFAGRGSQTITSAGKTFTQPIYIGSPGGTVTLADSLNTSLGLTVNQGTFNAVTYNVTCSTFSGTSSFTRTIGIGSGTWTITGSGTSAWASSTVTNLTVTGTGTISLTSASAKSFVVTVGITLYAAITINQGGAGALTMSSTASYKDITNSYAATGATSIIFSSGSISLSQFTGAGTSAKLLTISGSSSASPATLILTGTTNPNVDYLTINNIRAYNTVDVGTWYVGTNSTNGGTYGFLFEVGPAAPSGSNSGNFFFLFF